jgi:hypothetical protein
MKKIKFSKTALVVLGFGAFVLVLATMFMIYSRQSAEQRELESSLAGTQTQLVTLLSGKAAVEAQLTEQQNSLAEAQALLISSQGSFPKVGTSIEYDEVLSEIAAFHNLKITSMTAEEPRPKKVEDITFVTVAFDVEVEGEVNSILGMVYDIANDGRFASATVDMVDITVPDPGVVIMVEEEREKPSAKIELVGYSYGGE